MSRDLYNELKPVQSIAPQAITSNTTVNGDSADLTTDEGYDVPVPILVAVGDRTDGTYTFEVQESDDDSTFTAVADADLQGTEPAATADGVTKLAYRGTSRYIRVSVTSTSVATGAAVSAHIVLGNPRTLPVS